MFNFFYKLYFTLFKGVTFGKGVVVKFPCNLYDCSLADEVFVGPFSEIQSNVFVGKRTRISSHSFIAAHTIIERDVFIGHSVVTVNDLKPIANNKDWTVNQVHIKEHSSIGSNATIMANIGRKVIVGASAVVTKPIKDNTIVKGNPAR